MGGVWRAFVAERRRRWASWLALAALVAVVGGTVLAGSVAARRTNSALPEFVRQYGADVAVYSGGGPLDARQLRGAGAHLLAVLPAPSNGNVRVGSTFVPSNDLSIFDTDGVNVHRIIKLLSGRWPTKPDEVLAGFSFEQAAGLHVGSVIRVPTYARSQAAQVYGSGQNVVPHGPIERFVVVGFEVNILDFPSSTPSYSLVASPAFLRAAHRSVLTGSVAFYRLDGGAAGLGRFAYVINHVTTGLYYPFGFDATLEAIESSIHPQVVGWWLFALLAALTGLALIGQALARQSLVERESFPTLSALGLTPSQLTGLGLMRATSIALVGSAGAVLLALLVSPLTPVGEARAAATSSGFFLDGLVVGVGALAIVLCVVGLAAYPAFRAAQARALVAAEERTVARSSRVARGLGRLGAAPSVLIGVRHALERGRGRGSVPVATALLGAVAAVTAISGTSVFGASLTRLLDTPHLYGQNWTVDLSGFNSRGAQQVAAHAARLPGVEAVTYGVSNKEINVNGVAANLVAVETAKGAPLFTSISGAFPGLGEIGVGSQTLAAAHARVGGMVTVGVIGPNGRSYTRRLRVSGTLVFPPVLSAGAGLGDGAAIAYPEVFQVLCGTGSSTSPCVRQLRAKVEQPTFTNWGMAIETAPTAAGRRAKEALEQRFSQQLDLITQPTNLVNFGQAVSFPLLLGAMLALFGAATLVHLLLVSVSRRRRELALLKVLGFLRRQAAAAVGWQSATVAVVGIVAGIPLGIAVGNVVWRAFASSVGAVPSPVVPFVPLALIGGTVLVGSVVLAVAPAIVAARLHPAEALHES